MLSALDKCEKLPKLYHRTMFIDYQNDIVITTAE